MASDRDTRTGTEFIELPAPTAWPLFAAAGVALVFAGLVTHVLVSMVGVALALRGAIGWWHEVLPEERVERVRVRPPAERARPVQPATHAVAHLVAGVSGHRVRIPEEIHPYSAGIRGGLAGAVAMAVIAELYGLIFHGSLWYPINLLAAIAVPSLAAAPLQELLAFNTTGLVVAIIAHLVISVFVGLLYAVALPMFPRHPAIWGGLLGPLLWSGLLWTSLDLINPALHARISWTWFVASQVAFGLVAGFVVARTVKIATMQTWPFAVRAGIEAPGLRGDDR
jgi:hypothetical protein